MFSSPSWERREKEVFHMGLFSKKCSVCGAKLPDKRRFKGVCNACGMNYHMYTKQMHDSIVLVDGAKTPMTGYNRCLFALRLAELLQPFAKANLYSYPQGSYEMTQEYLTRKAMEYKKMIWAQNSKKSYERKVGLPPISHYKKLYNPKYQGKEGCCKGCWGPKALNGAGYCLDCIIRASSIPIPELDAFKASHNTDGLSEDEIICDAIKEKLLRERDQAGK